jgi:hypothetical protein
MGRTEPVLIQDKNGKTTTVHRSVTKTSDYHDLMSPPPPVAAPSTPAITNEYIISLFEDRPLLPGGKTELGRSIYANVSERNVDDALDVIHEEEGDVLTYAAELMTTGTGTGQEMVKDSFTSIVNSTAQAVIERDTHSDWDEMLPSGAHIKSTLVMAWNIGNVLEESDLPNSRVDQQRAEVACGFINTMRRFIGYAEEDMKPVDEVYWRGIAALAVTETVEMFSQTLPEHGREFIDWAGHQENLSPIFRVVRERGVLHPETIEGIIKQTGIEKSLRDGLL